VVLDDCVYVEQLQAVGVEGGVAGNVVPDSATVTVNYRFAPDRNVSAARGALSEVLASELDAASGDRLEVIDAVAGALPALGHPVLAALVATTRKPPAAKLGWTDVATFAAIGIPAANFGPGDPLLAHTSDEHVSRQELEHVRDVLAAVLTGTT
jgi:succinyl-diaminopimelate desuccinylase